jgi:hypothetical protein
MSSAFDHTPATGKTETTPRNGKAPQPSSARVTTEYADERIARQGWGATLRLALLILARGAAIRVAAQQSNRANRRLAASLIVCFISAIGGAYARAHGWHA